MEKILNIYKQILNASNSVEAINIISKSLLDAVYDSEIRHECEKLAIYPLHNDGDLEDKCIVYIYRNSIGGEPDYYIIDNFMKFQGTFINLSTINKFSLFTNYNEYKLLYYSLNGELDKFKVDKCAMLEAARSGVTNVIICGIYEY